MKRCAAKPYEGQERYIFVSYCHKDRAYVFPVIEQLVKDGYRVWYDEGIDPGSEWPEIIAKHLNGSAICIAFITANSLNSHNCRREINFALLKKKYFISVILEPVQMSLGMEMQLSSSQSIFKYTLSSEKEFFAKLYDAKELEKCKGLPNYSIEVSTSNDYLSDNDNFDKVRDPFSDRWFAQGDKDIIDDESRKMKETARKVAEEEERRKAEEAVRKAAEEEERRKEKEDARKAAEEEERRKAEEAARKAAEDEERRKAEEAARKAAEDEERRKAQEAARKAAEEEERRKEEEDARKAAEDEKRRKTEEIARKAVEEAEKARQQGDAFIHVLKREKTGEFISINKTPFRIGRSDIMADYVIADNRSISRSHATLIVKNNDCYIIDNKSLNKTFLNENIIIPEKEYILSNNDNIRLYNERFVYLKCRG